MAGESKRGFVYAMVNPQYLHLIKIGYTESANGSIADLRDRVQELSRSTGVPDDFIVIHAVYVDNCTGQEKKLHRVFSHLRYKRSKEFFWVDLDQISDVTEEWKKRQCKGVVPYVAQGIKEYEKLKIESGGEHKTKPQKLSRVSSNQSSPSVKRTRNTNINFQSLGIPEGATLTLKDNPSIKATVADGKVCYRSKIMTLSRAAQLATGIDKVGGGKWWTYQGETLRKRRLRMESGTRAGKASKKK